MTFAEFIAHYNTLVIGDVRVAYFQLIQEGAAKVWATIPAPVADPETFDIEPHVSSAAEGMSTGSHLLRLVAVANSGQELGAASRTVHGKSGAARQAYSDSQSMAKAIGVSVDIQAQQMQQMAARSEAAEKRARHAEDTVAQCMEEKIKIFDLCHSMQLREERSQLEAEEAKARTELLQTIGLALLPLANKVAELGVEGLDFKVRKMRREWEADDAAHRQQYSPRPKDEPKPN